MRVLQQPAPVLALAVTDNVDCIRQARIASSVDSLKVIECAQDVVVPSRGKRKANECGLDDFADAVGAKEPVHQQELPPTLLCGPHFPDFAPTVQFIEPQTLKH